MATLSDTTATKVIIEKVGESALDWSGVLMHSAHAKNPNARPILLHALAASEVAYIAKYNGEVMCVWGLIPPTLLSEAATLWLLPTDLVTEHQFIFVRHSQLVVEKLLKRYPIIIGTTAQDNKRAIRWIKWLGGEYTGATHKGWLSFVIRKK